MAADSSKDNVPNFIFTSDDGDALTFFIRPSETKARLRPLIEKAGGVVTSKSVVGDNVIRIAVDGDIATPHGYLRAQYVDDCLDKGQLLDKEDYSCTTQSKTAAVTSETSNVEYISDSHGTGRTKYTEDDDRAILQYVARHPLRYGGNVMWKKMELMKITSHSWQSMKDRFLKYLEDSLPEYIELEKERQEEMEATKRKHSGEDATTAKRMKSRQVQARPVAEDRAGIIYEFLKEMEDPPEDLTLEETEDADEIEKQLIEQIQFWCQKYSLSKKAIAAALHLNSGDLDKTEHLLEKKTMSPDSRIWSQEDDEVLLKGDSFSELCSKYGREAVLVRRAFLADWRVNAR